MNPVKETWGEYLLAHLWKVILIMLFALATVFVLIFVIIKYGKARRERSQVVTPSQTPVASAIPTVTLPANYVPTAQPISSIAPHHYVPSVAPHHYVPSVQSAPSVPSVLPAPPQGYGNLYPNIPVLSSPYNQQTTPYNI